MMPGNSVSAACSLRTRLSRISCLTGRERRPDCRSSPRVLGTMKPILPRLRTARRTRRGLLREIGLVESGIDGDVVECQVIDQSVADRGDDVRWKLVPADGLSLDDG